MKTEMEEVAPPLEWSALEARHAASLSVAPSSGSGPRVWSVRRDALPALFEALAGEPEWAPWQLVDLSAADRTDDASRPEAGPCVLYWLAPARGEDCLRLDVDLDGHASLPSVAARWPVARWLEREVRELFGIEFDGAPDRRPLLLGSAPASPPLRRSPRSAEKPQ